MERLLSHLWYGNANENTNLYRWQLMWSWMCWRCWSCYREQSMWISCRERQLGIVDVVLRMLQDLWRWNSNKNSKV
jgi:hypothetical protein